jgi:hypothetical protein
MSLHRHAGCEAYRAAAPIGGRFGDRRLPARERSDSEVGCCEVDKAGAQSRSDSRGLDAAGLGRPERRLADGEPHIGGVV